MPAAARGLLGLEHPFALQGLVALDRQQKVLLPRSDTGEGSLAHKVDRGLLHLFGEFADRADTSGQFAIELARDWATEVECGLLGGQDLASAELWPTSYLAC